MNTVSEKEIAELIRIIRKFGETGDDDLCTAYIQQAYRVSDEVYGDEKHWLQLIDFIFVLCGHNPLKACTNEEIYVLLKMVDIDVIKEHEEEI